MKKRLTKALSLGLILAISIGLLASCGEKGSGGDPAGGSTSNGGTDGKKDTLTIAIRDDIPSMSPFEVCNGLSQLSYDIVYEKLFVVNPDGSVEPQLVESYEQVSDTQYNFKLKEGVLFHDGSELTAEDVKASLDNAGTYPVPSVHDKEVEATGKYTFTITTPQPDSLLLYDDLAVKWNSIVPKKLLDEGHDFKTDPVGSGPYKFADRATSEYIHFESFKDYRSEPATDGRFENIMFKVIPEASSRTIALENGEVDFIMHPEFMDLQRMIENPNIQVDEAQGQSFFNLTINQTKPGLDNIYVRKAMAYAIDPQPVMDVAINGYGKINRTMIVDGYPGCTDVNAATYDPEKAKEYLAMSGYAPGELTFDAVPVDGDQALTVIQNQLDEIGIHLNIVNQEDAVWIDESSAGEHSILFIANSGARSTYSNLNLMFHSSRIGGANRNMTSNAELDSWLEQVPYTFDETEEIALFEKCSEYIQDQCALIPLFIKNEYLVHSADLTGFAFGPYGEYYLYQIRCK